jgi:cytochrome c oxidase subunit 4
MDTAHKEHVLPVKTYLAVTGALFVLTVVTVAISYLDLGGWNAVVAIGVASIKVTLVATFFMHLKYDNRINLFIFLIGITFVTIFITLTMFDTLRRADIYEIQAQPINDKAIIYQQAETDTTQQSEEPQH